MVPAPDDSEVPPSYEIAVEARISQVLGQGSFTFNELVRRCGGAYPTVVKTCLDRLQHELVKMPTMMFAAAHVDRGEADALVTQLVEGNPVLSSWYFTIGTCHNLANLRPWERLRLAFLGAPRLFEWFRILGLGAYRALIDYDHYVLNLLRANQSDIESFCYHDIQDGLPHDLEGRFDVVFFDPPWYVGEYHTWLATARQLAPEGVVIFPLFPDLTRPLAEVERKKILAACGEMYKAITKIAQYVEYDVPSFERAELDHAGLGYVGPWKAADLIIAERPRRLPLELNGVKGRAKKNSDVTWKEVDLGELRIFIKLAEVQFARESEPLLRSVTELPTLASPSRRNPELRKANVLTSRGHACHTRNPAELLDVLGQLSDGMAAGRSGPEIVRDLDVDALTSQLLTRISEEALRSLR